MKDGELIDLINRVNTCLKTDKFLITIKQKGNRLYLRGTFPPRPGSNNTKLYQQEIAIALGATVEGLHRAEKEARKVGELLDEHQFSWEPYLRHLQERQPSPKTTGDWINELERDYFTRRARTPSSVTTWNTNYQEIFTHLPYDKPLTVEVLKGAIASTRPDTRMRQKTCLALDKLAQMAGVEFEAKRYIGNYSLTKVSPRSLPTDCEIVEWYERLSNPAWQWAFGCWLPMVCALTNCFIWTWKHSKQVRVF
jgi:hypothetical protein